MRPQDSGERWRSPPACGCLPCRARAAKYWKVPTRRWLAATRVNTAPGKAVSRTTCSPGGHRGQGPGSGHAERRHGFADDVLAQDRAERGSAVAATGERSWAGALELDVVAYAVAPDHFAQQVGAAIAELRHKMAELVSGIGLCQRLGSLGDAVAGQDLDALRTGQRVRIEPEVQGQFYIDLNQDVGLQLGSGSRGRRSAPASEHRCFRS